MALQRNPKTYRVKDPGQHVVRDPDSGLYVAPNPNKVYTASDPLVKAYPWLFETHEEHVERAAVEDATANPGERKSLR